MGRDMVSGNDQDGQGEIDHLVKVMRPSFGKILSSFRIPPHESEDLVQDVLIQFLHKRSKINSPKRWLRGALRNECRMYWRGHSRKRTTAVDTAILETFSSGSKTPDQELRVLRRNLSRWIASLDYRCRAILELRFKLGYESREVAEELGYRRSSIDKVTRRCLDALARKLAAALPPGAGLGDGKRS